MAESKPKHFMSDQNKLADALGLPSGFDYCIETREPAIKEIHIRGIHNEEAFLAWLHKYSDCTKTTWRTLKTYPNPSKDLIFRKLFRCHHKIKPQDRTKQKYTSKNTDCPAELAVKIKRPVYRFNGEVSLAVTHPTSITLKEEHNHSRNSAAALTYRDMSEETRQSLIQLFHRGHSPASALQYLKMDLMLKDPDLFNQLLADSSKVPSYSGVRYLYLKEFGHKYDKMKGSQILEDLNKYITEYNSSTHGGRIKFGQYENHYFVAVCTPLMSRVHRMVAQAAELMMVEASGRIGRQRHRVYMLVTHTSAGSLPLGLIVSDCEEQNVFLTALQALLEILPPDRFYQGSAPLVIITDNELKVRVPLSKVFPDAKLLLCQFHVLKSFWSWLCYAQNNVHVDHRQEVYLKFTSCVYCWDTEKFQELADSLMNLVSVTTNCKLHKYVGSLLASKAEWAACYRKCWPTRGTNTTNYVEVVFRILKDVMLEHVMAYNITQLLDFLVTRFEQYLERRLLDFSLGRYQKSLLKNFLPIKSTFEANEVKDNGDGTFRVPSETASECHIVDINKWVCSCSEEMSGKLCKHLSAVLLNIDSTALTQDCTRMINNQTKLLIYKLATNQDPPVDWLSPLKKQSLNKSAVSTPVGLNFETTREIHSENYPELQELETGHEEEEAEKEEAEEEEKGEELKEEVRDDIPSDSVCREWIDTFYGRLKDGLMNNPALFKPALMNMQNNLIKYAATETGLLSFLHTMGNNSGLPQKNIKKLSNRRNGARPTTMEMLRLCLSGKRRRTTEKLIGSSCPVKKNTTEFCQGLISASIPQPRKKRCLHNLEKCVQNNVSLGKTRTK